MSPDVLRRSRDDAGASLIEYVGLLSLVALIVAALIAVGLPGRVGSASHSAICQIFDSGHCGKGAGPDQNGGSSAQSPGGTPGNNGVPAPADNLQLAAYNMPQNAAGGGGSQASRLPRGGDYPFVPKKGQNLDNPKSITRKSGRFVDADDNEWQWDPVKDEWDVQHKIPGNSKKTSHTNVGEDGEITHGEDNFPRKPRPKGGNQGNQGGNDSGSDNKGSDTAKSVAIGGGILAGGGLLWWGAKVLSPACGPFVVVCAVAF